MQNETILFTLRLLSSIFKIREEGVKFTSTFYILNDVQGQNLLNKLRGLNPNSQV